MRCINAKAGLKALVLSATCTMLALASCNRSVEAVAESGDTSRQESGEQALPAADPLVNQPGLWRITPLRSRSSPPIGRPMVREVCVFDSVLAQVNRHWLDAETQCDQLFLTRIEHGIESRTQCSADNISFVISVRAVGDLDRQFTAETRIQTIAMTPEEGAPTWPDVTLTERVERLGDC